MKTTYNWSAAALILAAIIAAVTALAHLSCILLGPVCYQAQMAPDVIVQSAIDGSWLAPVSNLVISSLFLLCAVYALSAAGVLRKLPLLRVGVYSIAVLCIVRGIATVPLSLMYPNMVSGFSILAGLLWMLAGLLFLFGCRYNLRRDLHGGN